MIEGKDRGLGLVSPSNCSNPESCFAFAVFVFEIKVNKEKLTDLCAGNSSNIQQVLT